MFQNLRLTTGHLAVILVLIMPIESAQARSYSDFSSRNEQRLEHGDVVLKTESQGEYKHIIGTIDIDEPAEKIWPIIVNPYEFQKSIFPRMTEIDLLRDEPDITLMKVTVDCGLVPSISYVVESRYVRNQRIDFKRIDGIPKEFNGYWHIQPLNNGTKSRVTYCLYVNPGIPLPQWLVREALKVELPRTLRALRKRVLSVCENGHTPAKQTIVAARCSFSS